MDKKNTKKIIIALVVIALIIAAKGFHLGEYLTLAYVKESQKNFTILYEEHRVSVISIYIAIYLLITSLSLPGAAVLGLLAGSLFGLLTGTIVVSFASTTGATLACAVSRFILRDWVQKKFSGRLKTVNEGVEKEGAFYLFTLRLIPVFPFWLINMIMGLTKMPLKTFYWVSQIGMLPGTIIFVNAGKEIAKIDSLSGILSPGLIGSFVLLGLFPITTKKILAFYNQRRKNKAV